MSRRGFPWIPRSGSRGSGECNADGAADAVAFLSAVAESRDLGKLTLLGSVLPHLQREDNGASITGMQTLNCCLQGTQIFLDEWRNQGAVQNIIILHVSQQTGLHLSLHIGAVLGKGLLQIQKGRNMRLENGHSMEIPAFQSHWPYLKFLLIPTIATMAD